MFIAAKRVEGCSERSLKYYDSTIRQMTDRVNKPVREINTDDLRVYLANYQKGRVSNNIYFTALPAPAASLAAELAVALTGAEPPGHIYLVEPTGPFEDDPNVTNKRFPGNPTKSYRTTQPLRVVRELPDWQGHSPDQLEAMRDGLERLKEQGVEPLD